MRYAALFVAAGTLLGPSLAAQPARLKVCADPNNLPFSNQEGEGFENALAKLLAQDLGQQLEYTWWPQHRGALRNTLKAGLCDVVLGVPRDLGIVATTEPYYSSSYVFVSRADRGLDIRDFDDARLRSLTLGVQLVGDDYANTPPVHALSARGIVENVRGFSVLGDYGQPMPAATILKAVESGSVDVAVVWGPLAGYYALHASPPLRLTPTPASDGNLPLRFDISLGVRRSDKELRARLNTFIATHRRPIAALLARYGVPRP